MNVRNFRNIVNSEKLFISAAGSTYTENWNRLSPDNAEKRLFIMKNIKTVDLMH